MIAFSSCSVLNLVDLDKKTKSLELGMTRQEAVSILGTSYIIESAAQLPEGKLEVLLFHSEYSNDYLLYFLDGELTEYHRYIVPSTPEVRVVREDR